MSIRRTSDSAFQVPFLRSAYNYDTNAASDQSGLLCEDESLAQQQFKDDNNPNNIMDKFARTGDLALFGDKTPQFGDFTDAVDYRTALHRVNDANAAFADLSAAVRSRFNNDPAEFLEFFNNPANADEAIKLGIATRKDSSPLHAEGGTPSLGAEGTGGAKPSKKGVPVDSKTGGDD